MLKGRSNYVCLQRLREVQGTAEGQLEIEEFAATTKLEIKRLAAWAATSTTGDLAELDWAPSDTAQRAVTVGSDECPGATRCPMGGPCFAERARQRAAAADVVVVNLHLYGLHVASGGVILPEHDVLVVDEAHQLEDIMSDTVGLQIGPGRFTVLAGALRRIIDDPKLIGGVAESAQAVREVLGPYVGQRLPTRSPLALQDMLIEARGRIEAAQSALRAIDIASSRTPSSASCARSSWRRGCRITSTPASAIATATSRSSPAGPSTRGSRSPRSTSARCCRTASGRSAPRC